MKSLIGKDEKRIQVFFRILPQEKLSWDQVKILDDHKTVYVKCLNESIQKSCNKNTPPTFWTFQTDQVFFNETQKVIYNETCVDVLDNVFKGHNGIIMAFGQTGTGKSTTTGGLKYAFEDRGIIPRLIADLFKMEASILANNEKKICTQISYVEIGRNYMADLLRPYPCHINNFNDLKEIKVKKDVDAFKHLFLGEARKELVQNSSYPSHCASSVFTFHITTKNIEVCNKSVFESKLHIIDAVGADVFGNPSCMSKEYLDVGLGNLAKSQLEQFLLVLNTKVQRHIRAKQRLNPLIQYLGDSLNTESLWRFIGHLRITPKDMSVTTSMLKFGQLIKSVKPSKYEMALKDSPLLKIYNLQQELTKLKADYTYNSLLMSNKDLAFGINKDRYSHIKRTVNEYIENKTNNLPLINTADITTAFQVLKDICENFQCENKKLNAQIEENMGLNITNDPRFCHSKSSSTKRSGTSSHNTTEAIKIDSKFMLKQETSASSKPERRLSVSISSSKRRSSSHGLLLEKNSKSKSKSDNILLVPEIAPEFRDAWNSFLVDKKEEYMQLLNVYGENQTEAKKVYKNYVEQVALLNEAVSDVEKRKTDLILAKLTSQYQKQFPHQNIIEAETQIGDEATLDDGETDIADTCDNLLRDAQTKKIHLQEEVLKWQAELREHLEMCRNIKQDFTDKFDGYCKEKYQMQVVADVQVEKELMEADSMDFYNIVLPGEQSLEPVSEKVSDSFLADQFKNFRQLMEHEKKRKEKFKAKRKSWVSW